MIRDTGKDLDELTADLKEFPQKLLNVRVREKQPLEEIPSVQTEIRAAAEAFKDSGRVLVRYSGTERLARVMVEGEDAGQVEIFSNRIAEAIQDQLGE